MYEEWESFEIMGFNNHAGKTPNFSVIFYIFGEIY